MNPSCCGSGAPALAPGSSRPRAALGAGPGAPSWRGAFSTGGHIQRVSNPGTAWIQLVARMHKRYRRHKGSGQNGQSWWEDAVASCLGNPQVYSPRHRPWNPGLGGRCAGDSHRDTQRGSPMGCVPALLAMSPAASRVPSCCPCPRLLAASCGLGLHLPATGCNSAGTGMLRDRDARGQGGGHARLSGDLTSS